MDIAVKKKKKPSCKLVSDWDSKPCGDFVNGTVQTHLEYQSRLSYRTTAEHYQLAWLKHGSMCVEGVRQMGCVWYFSLNIMRRECASPILGPNWWQETQCPLIREGSFPSSKIMRWQCIQLSLDRDRVRGGRTEGETFYSTCLLPLISLKSNCHSLYQCWTHKGSANYFITVTKRL